MQLGANAQIAKGFICPIFIDSSKRAEMNRRDFFKYVIGAGAALMASDFLCNTAHAFAQEDSADLPATSPELLTFAVISDTHIHRRFSAEEIKLKTALSIINSRAPNIDACIVAGDLTDNGYEEEYNTFMSIYSAYGNSKAEKLFVMGNHDYLNGLASQLAQERFIEKTGESIQSHKIIKGYHFIQISTEDGKMNGLFSESLKSWLAHQLVIAEKNDPEKPIFITVHQHISNTVYGSDDWGNNALYAILKAYPQAIVFSGHSHYALDNERSIHQRDFTSIGTSSLSYMELEKGKIEGSIPKDADIVSEGLIVEVERNKIMVHRIDFFNNKALKKNWRLELPGTVECFTYTDDRKQLRKRPFFNKQSSLRIKNVTEQSATITFDQAKMPGDFVHSYRIMVIDTALHQIVCEFLTFSGFYFGHNMLKTVTRTIDSLKANTRYKVQVYAIESFGKESSCPLSIFFKTKSDTIMY